MIVDFTALVLIIGNEFYKVFVNRIPLFTKSIRQQIPYNERNDLRHNVPNWLGHFKYTMQTACDSAAFNTINGYIVSFYMGL